MLHEVSNLRESAPICPTNGAPASSASVYELLHHPYVVLRIAGLPGAEAQQLSTGRARRLLDDLESARKHVAPWVGAACDALEAAVRMGTIKPAERHAFLKARRNLFNGRLSGLVKQPKLLTLLNETAAAAITRADEELQIVCGLQEAFLGTFAAERTESTERLRARCLQYADFLKGVAFSSPSLIAALIGAQTRPDKDTGRRARNLDQSLFNYFIRASTKVSPLTYFTPVLAARWTNAPDAHLTLDNRGVASSVEISRRALSHIMAALFRNLKFWGDAHPLTLNPTLDVRDAALQFRDLWGEGPTNGRTWGVLQPTVSLPTNERILALVHFYQAAGSKSLFTLRELFELLKDQPVLRLEPREFVAFVAKAVYTGLLMPVCSLSDQEDWAAFLHEKFVQCAPGAAIHFNNLMEQLSCYSGASHETRLEQSLNIGSAFQGVCEALGAAPLDDDRTALFYEDCCLDGETPEVSAQEMAGVISDLHRVADLFPLLDFNHIIQSVSAGLFLRRSNRDGALDVDPHAQAIASEAEAIALRMAPMPLDQQEKELAQYSQNASELMRGRRLLLGAIWEQMASGEEVVLDESFVNTFASLVPEKVSRRPTSYTIMGQINDKSPKAHFILNRLYSGHSMLMSRFLRGQAQHEIGAVSRYLGQLADGRRMVEIPGVFGFNANLHPQFTEEELALPGRLANYRDTRKVPLSELSMRYNAELDRLVFVSPEGEDLSMHYFGFLNLMALPSIYQLLGRVNLQGLILDLWQDLYFAGLISLDRITVLPRVRYGDTVLSRRSIFLPVESLDSIDLSDADFFRSLHGTLRSLGEMGDHYSRLIPKHTDFLISDDDGQSNVAGTTDFKPAYLSLDIPLTVSGLKRRLQRRKRGVLLQETLPAIGKGGVSWNGAQHACEHQFEISRTRRR